MVISHGLKSLCVDSTCSVICALGQPPFCFFSVSSTSFLGIPCADISSAQPWTELTLDQLCYWIYLLVMPLVATVLF